MLVLPNLLPDKMSIKSVLPFGTYEGRQIKGVLRDNPEYLQLAARNEVFPFSKELKEIINATI